MAFLSMDGVSFSYPNGYSAVEEVNLQIERGENVAIVGQNGAGKTTTVKMLNRLFCPTRGDVIVAGKNTREYTTAQVSRIVGYVFQNPDDQIFHATVQAEVAFGPKMMKLAQEEVNARVDYALKLTGLEREREENPFNLPLSVRKFVTIASIIAMDTDALIFDEPTAGQDLAGNRRLAQIIRAMLQKGKTLITISHDMEFVASNFSRVIVMSNKRIICDGTPEQVFWNFDALHEAMLMQPYVSRICNALGIEGGIIRMEDAVEAIATRAGCTIA